MNSNISPALETPSTWVSRVPFSAWLGLAVMLPMLVSAFVFRTYDIVMASTAMEAARQVNAPFVIAELVVVRWAIAREMRVGAVVARLDAASRAALGLFVATFWVGTVFYSQATPFALLQNLVLIVHLLFAAAICHLAAGEALGAFDPAPLALVVTAVLAVFAVLTILAFYNPPEGRPLDTIEWQFAIPGFISVRLLGACVAPWVAFLAWVALERGDEPQIRLWILPALALAFGVVFWTATRAAILGIFVSAAIAFGYFRLRPTWPRFGKTFSAVAIGAAVASLFGPHDDLTFQFFATSDLASANSISGGRLAYWNDVWTAYLTVPWFGAGPGATAWIMPGQFPHIQPHNLLLQFLISWGLPATALAMFLLVKAVMAAHTIARRCREAIPYVLLADCLLAISFVDGTFHFAQPLMLWMGAMGLVFAADRRDAVVDTMAVT